MAARMKRHGQWKDVKIDPNIFLKDDFANLVCMQQLTEYTLTDSSGRIISNISQKAKKKKRSGASKDGTDGKILSSKKKLSNKDDDSEEEPDQPKKKTKKKRKKKVKSTGDVPANTTRAERDEETTNEPQVVLKGKNKKGKRKKKKKPAAADTSTSHQLEQNTTDNDSQVKAKKRKSSGNSPGAAKKCRSSAADAESSEGEGEKHSAEAADMSAWQDLYVPGPVLRALSERGFTSPTPIQVLALPSAIRDHMDLVGAAETGSGKTLAFGIPLLHRILELKAQKAANQEPSFDSHDSALGNDEDSDGDSAEMGVSMATVTPDNTDSGIVAPESINSDSDCSDTSASDDSDEGEPLEIYGQGEPLEDSGQREPLGDYGVQDQEGVDDTVDSRLEGLDDLDPLRDDPQDEDMSVMGEDFWEQPASAVRTYQKPLYGLILTPTRELAMQVKDHLVAAAKYTDIQVVPIVGGMAQPKQLRLLGRCPEIVVATPGRLWELLEMGEPHLSKVCGVSCLVIDEADRMVEKGHFQELSRLLVMMNKDERKASRRTYVFSATLTFVHSGPERFKFEQKRKKSLEKMTEKQKLDLLMGEIGVKPKPKVIDLSRSSGTAQTLTEARINTTVEEKDVYLYYFLRQHPGRTLVFANSKDCIRRLVALFKLLQCCPLSLHADMHQRQRLKNLDRFKGNSRGLLLATDVAARGLDIPDVQHVIHYQVPRTTENYVHRSGRTARATKEGLSVMLVGPDDVSYYRRILHNLSRDEDLPMFPIDQDTLANVKVRVTLARSIDTQEHRLNKKIRDNNWYEKAAKDMDIILDDEKLLNDLGSNHEQSQAKQKLAAERRQLNAMLKQSVQNNYSGKYPTWTGKLSLKTDTAEISGAITRMKEEHKQNQKNLSRNQSQRPSRHDRKREKQMKKKQRKKMKS